MNFVLKRILNRWFTLTSLLVSAVACAQLDVSGGEGPTGPCLNHDWSCVIMGIYGRYFIGHGQIRALDSTPGFSSAPASQNKLSTVRINYIYHFHVPGSDRLPEDAVAHGAVINFAVNRVDYSGPEQHYLNGSLIVHPTDFYFGEANTQIFLPPGTYIIRTTHEKKGLQIGEDVHVLSNNARFAYHEFTVHQ